MVIRWNIRPFIDGHYKPSKAAKVFDNIDPPTETALFQAMVGSSANVQEAVRVARRHFNDGCW